MQAVPITTKVVSSNPIHGEVYSIQLYVMKFLSDLQQVGGFLRVLRFPGVIESFIEQFFVFGYKLFKHLFANFKVF